MAGDWIKIHRQLREHALWRSEPFTRGQAWVDLLMLANWAPAHVRIRGVLVELKRGELVGSYRFLSERWNWSKGKVERFLDELKSEKQIETQINNVSQVITITNYDRYQSNEDADEDTSRDADGTQTGHQRDETKNKQEQEITNNKKQEQILPPDGGVRETGGPSNGNSHKTRNSHKYTAAFERWYALYPRKEAKGEAAKAFGRALKALVDLGMHGDFEQTLDWLCNVTVAFATSGKAKTLFVPHPATWLNQARYDDDQSTWNQEPKDDKSKRFGAGQVYDPAAKSDGF